MYIPADPAELHRETPIHGTLEHAQQLHDAALAVYWQAYSYQHLVQGAAQSLAAQHSSTIYGVRNRAIEQLVPGATLLAGSAEDARVALAQYLVEIERIHHTAAHVNEALNTHLSTIRDCAASITEIGHRHGIFLSYQWNSGPPILMPESLREAAVQHDSIAANGIGLMMTTMTSDQRIWASAAQRWHQSISEIATARAQWLTLITERQGSEELLRAKLEASGLGQLLTLVGDTTPAVEHSIAQAIAGEYLGDVGFTIGTEHHLLVQLIGRSDGFDLFENPINPTEVAENWRALEPWQRETLIAHTPWVIGNLAGLPYDIRGQANLEMLRHYVVEQHTLSPQSQAAVGELTRLFLEASERSISSGGVEIPITLVSLNLHSRVPMVVVGYGDLQTGDALTWQVPGMNSDADEAIREWNTAATNLYIEQMRAAENSHSTHADFGVLVFMAYDTPEWALNIQSLPYNPVSVLFSERAKIGAEQLAHEIDGMFASRAHDERLPIVSVVAHSYGTTVSSLALLRTQHDVSSFVMLGSAGLDSGQINSFNDLRVQTNAFGEPNVFTTMASADWIAPIGSNLSNRLQPNPDSAWASALSIGGAFGFSSDGVDELRATTGHAVIDQRENRFGYLDAGTQSLNSVARLTIGLGEQLSGPVWQTEQRALSLPEFWSRINPIGPVHAP